MNSSITITSKGQVTLPSHIRKFLNLKKGDMLTTRLEDKKIILESQKDIIDKLSGSVVVPEHLKGKDINKLIDLAKYEYFKEKYSKKVRRH